MFQTFILGVAVRSYFLPSGLDLPPVFPVHPRRVNDWHLLRSRNVNKRYVQGTVSCITITCSRFPWAYAFHKHQNDVHVANHFETNHLSPKCKLILIEARVIWRLSMKGRQFFGLSTERRFRAWLRFRTTGLHSDGKCHTLRVFTWTSGHAVL